MPVPLKSLKPTQQGPRKKKILETKILKKISKKQIGKSGGRE